MKTQQSYAESNLGTLYLVPTPIGNLDDMTFRAVQTLKEVDLVACEDTRVTQKLLNHFEIDTAKVSYHEHNVHAQTNELIRDLLDGKNIAQVSDAGMPSISDPGVELVAAAVTQNIPVVPLPGANAALTALIASGLAPQPFTFYGFLSRKKSELNEELEQLKDKTETLMFYESPHRLVRFLKELVNVFGEERKVVLARELTKRYEEFIRGTAKEVLDWADETELRGEFVVLVAGNDEVEEEVYWEDWTVLQHVEYKMTYEKCLVKTPSKPSLKNERSQKEKSMQSIINN
jgi:probable S-adenosylmethionine-dependent methyltransferase, YraL family